MEGPPEAAEAPKKTKSGGSSSMQWPAVTTTRGAMSVPVQYRAPAWMRATTAGSPGSSWPSVMGSLSRAVIGPAGKLQARRRAAAPAVQARRSVELGAERRRGRGNDVMGLMG
jgi:hypothetical protein